MCTNDIYVCRDSSRINCTLACLTLGYIPCKHYKDIIICPTVLKNKNLKFSGNFDASLLSTNGSKNWFSTETLIVTCIHIYLTNR